VEEEPSVAVLARRAAEGDEAAWGAVVDRFGPLLWAICRRFRLSAADADDVAQAVWLRLLERLPTLRDPAALPGWLATTTRNECLRLARTAARHPQQGLVEEVISDPRVDAGGGALDELLLRAERYDALRAAFARLGERCRRLLSLLMVEPSGGYSRIGAELGMPIGSIGPTRARCLEALRRGPELAALLADEEAGVR